MCKYLVLCSNPCLLCWLVYSGTCASQQVMLHLQCRPSQPGTMAEAGWLLEVGTVQQCLQRTGLLEDVVLLVRLTTGEGPTHAPLFLTSL